MKNLIVLHSEDNILIQLSVSDGDINNFEVISRFAF